jgi:hypothetical protein
MHYVEHIEHRDTALFERVCRMDLEGIVAKHSYGRTQRDLSEQRGSKIKNHDYSQSVGREKLFEHERHSEPVLGWQYLRTCLGGG